ncbi:WXG100 family type VII secretion target [Actinocrispum wychmicini]|uniref:PPE family protein n=1 Tax=Actinocrispum wychmicini TaxID=1213861 RepID=A0A4R2K6N9_9PSEU|nr:WXG100 family type VII secretion target [Actinocrispum wychmicini]TCO65589.1 PPE family protein [Actinocrispum wychmicini]
MTREELDITRWRGFSHAELYTQLQNGPGAGASAEPAARWSALSAALHDIGQDLQKAVAQAEASWSGKAANAAFAQLSDIATWAGPAATDAAAMQASVEQQAEHVARVRAAMPAPGSTPKPDPALAPVQQLIDLQSDHEPIERATSEAARKAFEAMVMYQNDTTTTADALPSFPEPPDTAGHHGNRGHNLLNILDLVPSTTQVSSAPAAAPVEPAEPPQRFSGHLPREAVAQAGFAGPMAPEIELRVPTLAAPPPESPMTGMAPLAPVAPTRQQDSDNSRRLSAGPKVPAAASGSMMENVPMVPGGGGSVSPSATTPTTAASVGGGGGADRAIPRRMGEPVMSGWNNPEAVEPVQPRRRRDRREDEKITESVEGAGSEVPPPVIGTGPYRQ